MPSITTTGISLRVHQNDYDTKSGEMMEGYKECQGEWWYGKGEWWCGKKEKSQSNFTLRFLHFSCGVLQCTCTCPLGYHCRLSQPAIKV